MYLSFIYNDPTLNWILFSFFSFFILLSLFVWKRMFRNTAMIFFIFIWFTSGVIGLISHSFNYVSLPSIAFSLIFVITVVFSLSKAIKIFKERNYL
jgi:hypothetical protein